MKIIKNEKLIKRNGQIGNLDKPCRVLVALGLGMYISFTSHRAVHVLTWRSC